MHHQVVGVNDEMLDTVDNKVFISGGRGIGISCNKKFFNVERDFI